MISTTLNVAPVSKDTNIGLWAAQVIGAALFFMSGAMKLFTPFPTLLR
ncbi:hypothetical protein ACJ5NV_11255 [Loktanella agnita]